VNKFCDIIMKYTAVACVKFGAPTWTKCMERTILLKYLKI